MIDSYSDIILDDFDASPNDIIIGEMPSPRNPHNKYPDKLDVRSGVVFGAGQLQWQGYDIGELEVAAAGAEYLIGI